MPVFPSESHFRKQALLAHLVSIACLNLPTTLAQDNSAPNFSTNYVHGDGLSPGYFLPPTSIPLASTPPSPLPSSVGPTPIAPAIVGSGVPDTQPLGYPLPQTLPSVETTSNPYASPSIVPPASTSEPQAQLSITSSPPYQPSVDLDLRSSNTPTSGYSQSAVPVRPLASPSPWFFSSNALLLKLDRDRNQIFTSSASDPSTQLLSTDSLSNPTSGGYELGLGRYFGCGRFALSTNYWGLAPFETTSETNSLTSGPLSTNLPFNTLSSSVPETFEGLFVGTEPLAELFNTSSAHRLENQRALNNLEMNLYWFALGGAARQPLPPPCSDSRCWTLSEHPTSANAPWLGTPSRLRLSLFSGVRWFEFQDQMRYSSFENYYQNRVENNLWGIQSGAITHLSITPRWSLWSKASAGVFNNRVNLKTSAGNGSQLAMISSSGTANGTAYDFDSSVNRNAFLGELELGLGWYFARGWSANLGYRVLGVTDLAKAQNQIPMDFRLPSQATSIHADESMFLHGLTLGAAYNF